MSLFNEQKNIKDTILEIEETSLRLHVYLRRMESENKHFEKIVKKIEKKGVSILTQKDKIEMSLFKEYNYYLGKMMAYLWSLENLTNNKEVPDLIQRLRGMIFYEKENKIKMK